METSTQHSTNSYQELREMEQELGTEILPGTEVMADVGSHHFVKGSKHVLVPQPSSDPHDPLNWSTKWKSMCIIASTMVSFTQGFGPLALAPMFPYYIKEFDSDLASVSIVLQDDDRLILISHRSSSSPA